MYVCMYVCILCISFEREPHFEVTTEFPGMLCDGGRWVGYAWSRGSSCGRLKLSKAGKDHESAAEGRECFLQEVRKNKRDGANLSGRPLVIKMKRT